MILSFVAASIFSFSAMAQGQDCKQNCQARQCDNACGHRSGKADKMYRPTSIEEIAFEGILLTPEQQAAVDKVKADCKAQLRARHQSADSVKCVRRNQCKREYLNRIKSILQPEQYVTFLENIVVAKPQGRLPGHAKFKGNKALKGKAAPAKEMRVPQSDNK